jgi:hypothetical protein
LVSKSGIPFEVLPADRIYNGKTYSNLAEDWFNWLLSIDADKRTLGRVVFLRSIRKPKDRDKDSEIAGHDSESGEFSLDPSYLRSYHNDPNIRVGSDRLQIYSDQYVFAPIITAYWIATKPHYDYGYMQDFNGLTIDYGDNPPDKDQLTINGESVVSSEDMMNFRISTSVFTAVVPEAEFGRSLKDYLEDAVLPGNYPAVVEGYFVLIKFNRRGTYRVRSYASAPREVLGSYVSRYLYDIEVFEREPRKSKGAPGFMLARGDAEIARVLSEKLSTGELGPKEVANIGESLGLNVAKNIKDIRAASGKD